MVSVKLRPFLVQRVRILPRNPDEKRDDTLVILFII